MHVVQQLQRLGLQVKTQPKGFTKMTTESANSKTKVTVHWFTFYIKYLNS